LKKIRLIKPYNPGLKFKWNILYFTHYPYMIIIKKINPEKSKKKILT